MGEVSWARRRGCVVEADARFNLQSPVVHWRSLPVSRPQRAAQGALGQTGKTGNTHGEIQADETIEPSAHNRHLGDTQATAILGTDGGEPTGRTADQPSFLGKYFF